MRQGAITASKGAVPSPDDPEPVAAPPTIIGPKPGRGGGIFSGGPRCVRLPLCGVPVERSCEPPGDERSASSVRSTREPLLSHGGWSTSFVDAKGAPGASCAPAGLCFPLGGAAGTASRPRAGSTVRVDRTTGLPDG